MIGGLVLAAGAGTRFGTRSKLLADLRGIDTAHLGDGLWVRPVDIARLLGARRYSLEIECVLDVRDDVLGDRRYLLRGGPDGATCVPTERSADVTIAVADVGAVSLGGVRLSRLARAGLIGCDDEVLLRRLDLALLADRAPAPGTAF